jgi:putative ATP-binding cassette transporter
MKDFWGKIEDVQFKIHDNHSRKKQTGTLNMNINVLDFFSAETNAFNLSVICIAILSGCCDGLLIFIINHAANILFMDASAEIVMIVIYVLLCIAFYVTQRYTIVRTIKISTQIIGQKRLRLLDKIRKTELRFIEKKGPSSIHIRITQDFKTISQSVPVLIASLSDLMTVVVIYTYIALISSKAFIVVILFMSGSIIYFYYFYDHIKKEIRQSRVKESSFFDLLNDVLKGFKQIKIHSKKSRDLLKDIDLVSKESEAYKVKGLLAYRQLTMNIALYQFIMYAALLFVMPIYFEELRFSILKIFAAILFASGPLDMFFRSFATVALTKTSIENLVQLDKELDQTPEQKIYPDIIPKDFKKISLQAVTFEYKDNQGDTVFYLGPVDLEICKGQIVFIVGGNGSGKSTLLKLITGLYPPLHPGKIQLDNETIDLHTYAQYRNLFSIIFTDYYLFKKLYGLENVDKKKVNELLKMMHLSSKTKYKDNQFSNTNLSTGQRKRIACIEALLEDKPIYIFDEWTADQDPEFRKFLYDTVLIDLKNAGKTIIVVTHDDRYFDRADQLITLEEGKIQKVVYENKTD